MLGKRAPQRGMFEADHLYLDFVGRDSFYGFLATERGNLFRDEDFGRLYCPDNGRNSVPPSLLATALLLQAHDRVSDEEAKARADFDMRWKVALGIQIDQRPFATSSRCPCGKSTLQLFRAQLILHDQVRSVFQRSLEYAQETGYLQGRKPKVRHLRDEGGVGHDPHPGPRGGERHLQPAGGWDQEAGLGAGQEGGQDQARGVGARAGVGSLLWLEREGRSGDRLERRASQGEVPEVDRG